MQTWKEEDHETFFAAFAPGAVLTDDGNLQALNVWAEDEIFRSHGHLEVDREEHGGLHLVGPFHSEQWGAFTTVWRFEVADGLIRRLDVAAA